jgi:hypothetical protein
MRDALVNPSIFRRLLSRPFLQGDRNRAQHIAGRSGLARPDFKLPRGLLHKHLDSRNDGDSLATRHPQQWVSTGSYTISKTTLA